MIREQFFCDKTGRIIFKILFSYQNQVTNFYIYPADLHQFTLRDSASMPVFLSLLLFVFPNR
jgi:hypothetical protein